MKYIVSESALYRLTARQWTRFVAHRAQEHATLGISYFGTYVGPVTDVTDWTPREAQREQFEVRQAVGQSKP